MSKKDKRGIVTYIKGTNGRPAINWTELFDSWCKSGKSKSKFLRDIGIDPGSGNAKRNTRTWTQDTREAVEAGKDVVKAPESTSTGTIRPYVPSLDMAELWQIVQGWRKGQAVADYQAADEIRAMVRALISESMVKRRRKGETVEVTSLKAQELRALAVTLDKIQRIQRLALGMSTDNLGVELPSPETDVPVAPEEDGVPVFIVEINKDGRFIRPKPRQVS